MHVGFPEAFLGGAESKKMGECESLISIAFGNTTRSTRGSLSPTKKPFILEGDSKSSHGESVENLFGLQLQHIRCFLRVISQADAYTGAEWSAASLELVSR